jgi:outer membrane protein TolC
MLLFSPPAIIDTQSAAESPAAKIDLAGAIGTARAENPLLKAAKAAVDERRGQVRTVKADIYPQFSLTGDFSRVRDVSMLNSSFGEMLLGGGDIPMPGMSVAAVTAPRTYYSTNLNVSQPLFYFGKISTAVEIAKMGEKEAAQAYRTSELNVLHGVAQAYLGVLAAKAETEVIQSRMSAARQFLSDVTAKLEVQSATKLDRLRAESELLAVMPDALQADANLRRTKEVLCGMLGLDPRTDLDLADMGPPPEDQSAQKGEERSEIAQLKIQEGILKANGKIIFSDYLPKFDLSAQYGYQASKTENMFKEPYDPWRLTVSMRWPLFDGLRGSGRLAQNRAQLEQVHQMRVNQERNFAVDMQSAEREMAKAKVFLEAAKKAFDTGQEALRVSRQSFDQGLITSLDLLQAERTAHQLQSQLRHAELGVWSAVFDYRRSLSLLPN